MEDHPLPTCLYHYTDAHGLVGILQSQTIWATNLHYLDGSEEFDYTVGLAKRVVRERAQATTDAREREALASFDAQLSTGGSLRVCVVSFSEVGDSLSQWRAYCPNGAGYSLGFVAGRMINEAATQGLFFGPCRYDEASQHGIMERALNGVMQSASWTQALKDPEPDPAAPGVIDTWLDHFLMTAATFKPAAFREEREWRLISRPRSGLDPRWRVRAGRSMLIPYVPVNLTAVRPQIPIQEIVVGPTPHPDLAMKAVGVLLASQSIQDCTIRHSSIPYRDE